LCHPPYTQTFGGLARFFATTSIDEMSCGMKRFRQSAHPTFGGLVGRLPAHSCVIIFLPISEKCAFGMSALNLLCFERSRTLETLMNRCKWEKLCMVRG
jgi:hypothetical protein